MLKAKEKIKHCLSQLLLGADLNGERGQVVHDLLETIELSYQLKLAEYEKNKIPGEIPIEALSTCLTDISFYFSQLKCHVAQANNKKIEPAIIKITRQMCSHFESYIIHLGTNVSKLNPQDKKKLLTLLQTCQRSFNAISHFLVTHQCAKKSECALMNFNIKQILQMLSPKPTMVDPTSEHCQAEYPEIYEVFRVYNHVRNQFHKIQTQEIYRLDKIDGGRRKTYREIKKCYHDCAEKVGVIKQQYGDIYIKQPDYTPLPGLYYWFHISSALDAKVLFIDALLFIDNKTINESNKAILHDKFLNALKLLRGIFYYDKVDPPLMTNDLINMVIQQLRVMAHLNNPSACEILPAICQQGAEVMSFMKHMGVLDGMPQQLPEAIISSLDALLTLVKTNKHQFVYDKNLESKFKHIIDILHTSSNRYIKKLTERLSKKLRACKSTVPKPEESTTTQSITPELGSGN